MTSIETFEAPYLGIDTESAPMHLAKGYARSVVNLLPGRVGRVAVRGNIDRESRSVLSGVAGAIWVTDRGSVLIGDQSGTTFKALAHSSWAAAGVVPTMGADTKPSNLYGAASVGDSVYGFSTTSRFIRWDAQGGSITLYTNGPKFAIDTTYWLNRLWSLGGIPAGGSTVQNGLIGWSDAFAQDAALPDTAAAWQDDVSGLTNKIVLPTQAGVGLGRLPNGLMIFDSNTVHLLLGSTPSSLVLRAGVSTHGAVSRDAIVEYHGMVIWASRAGVFAYDGAQEIELSDNVRTTLQSALNGALACSLVSLPNDYLSLFVQDRNNVCSNWLLHLPTRAWTQVEYANASVSPLVQVNAQIDNLGWVTAVRANGQTLSVLDDIVTSVSDNDAIGLDIEGGVANQYTASYLSRITPLATPVDRAVVRAATVRNDTDAAGAVPGDTAWQVFMRDSADAVVFDSTSMSEHMVADGIQSYRFDVNAETNDLYVEARYTPSNVTPANVTSTEMQDVMVEYEPAQTPTSF